MEASTKPEFSVNITTNITTSSARETSAALPMRMTISKLNFFYGAKQIAKKIILYQIKFLVIPRGHSEIVGSVRAIGKSDRAQSLSGVGFKLSSQITALRSECSQLCRGPLKLTPPARCKCWSQASASRPRVAFAKRCPKP